MTSISFNTTNVVDPLLTVLTEALTPSGIMPELAAISMSYLDDSYNRYALVKHNPDGSGTDLWKMTNLIAHRSQEQFRDIFFTQADQSQSLYRQITDTNFLPEMTSRRFFIGLVLVHRIYENLMLSAIARRSQDVVFTLLNYGPSKATRLLLMGKELLQPAPILGAQAVEAGIGDRLLSRALTPMETENSTRSMEQHGIVNLILQILIPKDKLKDCFDRFMMACAHTNNVAAARCLITSPAWNNTTGYQTILVEAFTTSTRLDNKELMAYLLTVHLSDPVFKGFLTPSAPQATAATAASTATAAAPP
jgi:hypothetical protein